MASRQKEFRISQIAREIINKWSEAHPMPESGWSTYSHDSFSKNKNIREIEKQREMLRKQDLVLEQKIAKIQAPYRKQKQQIENKVKLEEEKLLDVVTFGSNAEVLEAIQNFINMEIE